MGLVGCSPTYDRGLEIEAAEGRYQSCAPLFRATMEKEAVFVQRPATAYVEGIFRTGPITRTPEFSSSHSLCPMGPSHGEIGDLCSNRCWACSHSERGGRAGQESVTP